MLIGCLGNNIILGKDESEYGQNLNKVLKVLAENNVLLNEGKCQSIDKLRFDSSVMCYQQQAFVQRQRKS